MFVCAEMTKEPCAEGEKKSNTTQYFIVHTIVQVYTYTRFEHTLEILWTDYNNVFEKQVKQLF